MLWQWCNLPQGKSFCSGDNGVHTYRPSLPTTWRTLSKIENRNWCDVVVFFSSLFVWRCFHAPTVSPSSVCMSLKSTVTSRRWLLNCNERLLNCKEFRIWPRARLPILGLRPPVKTGSLTPCASLQWCCMFLIFALRREREKAVLMKWMLQQQYDESTATPCRDNKQSASRWQKNQNQSAGWYWLVITMKRPSVLACQDLHHCVAQSAPWWLSHLDPTCKMRQNTQRQMQFHMSCSCGALAKQQSWPFQIENDPTSYPLKHFCTKERRNKRFRHSPTETKTGCRKRPICLADLTFFLLWTWTGRLWQCLCWSVRYQSLVLCHCGAHFQENTPVSKKDAWHFKRKQRKKDCWSEDRILLCLTHISLCVSRKWEAHHLDTAASLLQISKATESCSQSLGLLLHWAQQSITLGIPTSILQVKWRRLSSILVFS